MPATQDFSLDGSKRERQLGFYERFRVILHDLGYHHNVSIIARYSCRAGRPGSLPFMVYEAFRHAIQLHPALGITVSRDDSQQLHFERLRSVNLHDVIKFELLLGDKQEQQQRLISLSADENNRGFDCSKGPLWRAIVLHQGSDIRAEYFHIAFVWHHVIGDGRSGLAVHNSLLEAFTRIQKSASNGSIGAIFNMTDYTCVPVSTRPLFRSMEELLPNSTKPQPANHPQDIPPRGDQDEKWTGGSFNYTVPISTKLAHLNIPADTVRRVLSECRRNNTTMTALLQAIVGRSLLDNIEENRIRTAVAVSLRRFFSPSLSIDDTIMGLWISTYTTECHRSQLDPKGGLSDLWRYAKVNTAKINDTIADGGKEVEIMALMGIEDYEAALKARAGQPRDNSFGLTNLGVFKAPPKSSSVGGVAIEEMLFSQSCHANGAAFQICIVSVGDGAMNIVFNWQEGIIAQERMDAIVGAIESRLADIGDGAS